MACNKYCLPMTEGAVSRTGEDGKGRRVVGSQEEREPETRREEMGG